MTRSAAFENRSLENSLRLRPIAIVSFDRVEIIDMSGPMEVFALANLSWLQAGLSEQAAYPTDVIAKKPGLIKTSGGVRVNADRAYGDIHDGIDTLRMPGVVDVNRALPDWIQAMSSRVQRLVSVWTGAFLLAETGLLDGRSATTHWAYCDRLAPDYPSVTVEPDRLFVSDGVVSTSGGVTSGIDLALSLVEADWDPEVARYPFVFLNRPVGQSQFRSFQANEARNHPDWRAPRAWIRKHPAEQLRIEVLAERMEMSPRNFARLFHTETGTTPAKFVEKARIDTARRHLVASDIRIAAVPVVPGFGNAERMRRAFIRNIGITPREYPARFGRLDVKAKPATSSQLAPVKARPNAQ